MKKMVAVFLLFVVFLAGCTGDEKQTLSSQMPQASPPLHIKPDKPFGYERLNEFEREVYDLLESGQVPRDGYFFDEALTPEQEISLWQTCYLYEANHMASRWRWGMYYMLYGPHLDLTQSEPVVGIGWAEGIDLRGEREQMTEQLQQTTKEILANLPEQADDFLKIEWICEEIAKRCEFFHQADVYSPSFNPNLTKQEDRWARHSSLDYGALVNGKAICEGYAAAFQHLAEQTGLVSLVIYGDARGVPHAWNLVWLDGYWYHVDVTWYDGDFYKESAYILATHEQMLQERTNMRVGNAVQDHPWFALPQNMAVRGSFFERKNRSFSDMDRLYRALKNHDFAAEPQLAVQMKTSEGWQQVLEWVYNQEREPDTPDGAFYRSDEYNAAQRTFVFQLGE